MPNFPCHDLPSSRPGGYTHTLTRRLSSREITTLAANETPSDNRQRRIAIFPGTFDPITYGHIDIIRRGQGLFDELVVAVGENPDKTSLIPQAKRVEIIRDVLAHDPACLASPNHPAVRVEAFTGLTVDFAREIQADVILRGIRNTSDLQFEFQIALTNRTVAGIETMFIMTSPEFAFTSSSLIRQIATMGGDISPLVPPQVLPHLT